MGLDLLNDERRPEGRLSGSYGRWRSTVGEKLQLLEAGSASGSGFHVRIGGLSTLPLRKQRVHTQIRRVAPSLKDRTHCKFACQVLLVTL